MQRIFLKEDWNSSRRTASIDHLNIRTAQRGSITYFMAFQSSLSRDCNRNEAIDSCRRSCISGKFSIEGRRMAFQDDARHFAHALTLVDQPAAERDLFRRQRRGPTEADAAVLGGLPSRAGALADGASARTRRCRRTRSAPCGRQARWCRPRAQRWTEGPGAGFPEPLGDVEQIAGRPG